jgi:agmatine deiminase
MGKNDRKPTPRQQDAEARLEVFAVDAAGDVVEVEAVEVVEVVEDDATDVLAADADGEVALEVSEMVETVEVDEPVEEPEAGESVEAEAVEVDGTVESIEVDETDEPEAGGSIEIDKVDVIETIEIDEREDPAVPSDEREAGGEAEPGEASERGEQARWRMPAETEPQERIWMAFPRGGAYLGDTAEELDEARNAWCEVAHQILRFEPVTMVVDPHDLGVARRYLSSQVELVTAPLDDAWMRDIGPSFVLDGRGRLGAATWRFNGWGAQDWAEWGSDSVIGALVAARAGATRVVSDLVNEGGGIQVDGLGTVLLTETVQLDPNRNPGRTREDVEAELGRTLGGTNPIWLERGLYRDAQRFGTRGHVDIVATIPSPGRLLVHTQPDAGHPDHEITRGILETLRASRTPEGTEWDIVELPAPQVLRDEDDFIDYSYINHLVVNGGVIAGTFGDPNDEQALDILAAAYEGREVVALDARPLFERGGGIHCITLQQPLATAG